MKLIVVCGARPNFIKVAPILDACRGVAGVEPLLVHTGQHYDERMSESFFGQLGLPSPDVNLGVGSGSHATQTAEVMKRFEPVCMEHDPDWVLVVGDVNSTIACALAAVKLGIRVAHVEAGLRSFDRSMPEEINRVLTDAISDLLFVTEQSGIDNLLREGIHQEKIRFVGNVMIDTLRRHRKRAEESTILSTLDLSPKAYGVLTLHRPSNVDEACAFLPILDAIESIAHDQPIVFPVHPRTRASIDRLGLGDRLDAMAGLRMIEPLGYLDFLRLMADAAVVLTDSGGMQEETTILGVPCLTLRENTERPVTIEQGTNRLAGVTTDSIRVAYVESRRGLSGCPAEPELWDGRAAERIIAYLVERGTMDAGSAAVCSKPLAVGAALVPHG